MKKHIDWSIYDNYIYKEGDGVYLDEKSLYEGIVKPVDYTQPFVNIKHPNGEHIVNSAVREETKKSRSNSNVPCSQCNEYKLNILTSYEGFEIIPLCLSCLRD